MATTARLLRSPLLQSIRHASSRVTVSETRVDGLRTVAMHNKPVNAMSMSFLNELSDTISTLENDKSCSGFVLASDVPNLFMAGLDITEMYQKEEDYLRSFWSSVQNIWLQLNTTRLVNVAAIEGHSPAGGCLVSLCSDERVMLRGAYQIGLNETKLGIVAPQWFIDSYVATIGQRQADRLLQLGHMVSPDEALALGMVDAVVDDNVREKAIELAEGYVAIPSKARHLTKLAVRGGMVERLRQNRQSDTDHFVQLISQEQVQKGLGMYLASLAKKQS
eukprot:TRINITY_DN1171_c0_g1_i2.p1 TRINITY_DN1171_c0_g1~~TRINITY_DN1171_c0_g1_i2.p1  ORF type:complete len:277 (+),score=53.62 TRINITY_DN1171_c0_g1_i2:2-832(+)